MVDYEKDILSMGEGMDLNLKLNPDFYIHMAILSAQKSILLSTLDGKTSEGINSYLVFVRQVGMIAESAGYLMDKTKEAISKEEIPKDTVGRANYATKCLGLIMSDIFGHKPQRGKLTLNSKISDPIGEALSKEDERYESGLMSAVKENGTKE